MNLHYRSPRVFFKTADPKDLTNVQWAYLGTAASIFFPAAVFFFPPILKVTDRYAIGRGDFALGRIATVDAKTIIKPRWILTIFISGVINYIAPPMGTHGKRGVAVLCLVPSFKSSVFPTIFTLSIRGLGRHTKRGSPWIVASVSLDAT
ncbi:MAG: hypothetical protein Q9175_001692 [Cornicularia normoerica]